MKSIIHYCKHVLLASAAVLSMNCHALTQSDAGCTESDGVWTCSGGDVVVIGTPIEPTDGFGCRKNPERCLPTEPRPPRPPTDGGGTGPGRDREIKDHELVNAAALRAMDCGQLRQVEDLYKAYVETSKGLIEAHQRSLTEADAVLSGPAYAANEIDFLHDVKNASCNTYEITKSQRLNGPKECFERPNNKPPVCNAAAPSRLELDQYQRCRDSTRELNARLGDQTAWKNRKAAAETRIQSITANLRYDSAQLAKIRAEMFRKKCVR